MSESRMDECPHGRSLMGVIFACATLTLSSLFVYVEATDTDIGRAPTFLLVFGTLSSLLATVAYARPLDQ